MKKNFNVNISGFIFHIDEDAYILLNEYLERLRRHFHDTEDAREILHDIEHRIAELLKQQNDQQPDAITSVENVHHVIGIMGEPDDIDDDEETIHPTGAYKKAQTKKLFRHPKDKLIGGVAGGLASYFHINTLWVRIAFIAATPITAGIAVVAYILGWILLPEATSAADMLEMEGKPVNIGNIEEKIKHEFKDISNRFNEMNYSPYLERITRFFNSVIIFILNIIKKLIRIVAVTTGSFLFIIGLIFGLSLLLSLVGIPHFAIPDAAEFNNFSLLSLMKLSMASPIDQSLGIITALLTIGIPVLLTLYGALKLIMGKKFHFSLSGYGLPLLGGWVGGLILLFYLGMKTGHQYSEHTSSTQTVTLTSDTTRIIHINNPGNEAVPGTFLMQLDDLEIRQDADNYYTSPQQIQIIPTQQAPRLEIVRSSNGKNYREAEQLCNNIISTIEINDTAILLPSWISFPRENMMRHQAIIYNLFLTEGQRIEFDHNTRHLIRDYHNRKMARKGMLQIRDQKIELIKAP